jgi:hypothetical protein
VENRNNNTCPANLPDLEEGTDEIKNMITLEENCKLYK